MSMFADKNLSLPELVERADHVLLVTPYAAAVEDDPFGFEPDADPFSPWTADDSAATWEFEVLEVLSAPALPEFDPPLTIRAACWAQKQDAQDIVRQGGSVWTEWPSYRPSAAPTGAEPRILFLVDAGGVLEFAADGAVEVAAKLPEVRALLAQESPG